MQPGNAEVERLLRTANLHKIRREWPLAQYSCEQALALEPNNADVREFLGDLQAARGEYDAALATYRAILVASPNRESVESKVARLVLKRPPAAGPPPGPATPPGLAMNPAAPPPQPAPAQGYPPAAYPPGTAGYPPPGGWNPRPAGPSPVRAFLSSLFLPGVGQFYNGQYLKGAAILVATLVLGSIWSSHLMSALPEMKMLRTGDPEAMPAVPNLSGASGLLFNWSSMALGLLWIYAIIDATWTAARKSAANRTPGW